MEFIDALTGGFSSLGSLPIAIALVIGAALGIVVGVLPGVGPGVTIAVLLPFTYGMAPLGGISLLLGVYCGAFYGGAVTSIIIRTPGEASSIMTMFDGYPLARQGQAQRALSLAFMATPIPAVGSLAHHVEGGHTGLLGRVGLDGADDGGAAHLVEGFGAIARGVDAARGRARDPVDGDEPAVVGGRRSVDRPASGSDVVEAEVLGRRDRQRDVATEHRRAARDARGCGRRHRRSGCRASEQEAREPRLRHRGSETGVPRS